MDINNHLAVVIYFLNFIFKKILTIEQNNMNMLEKILITIAMVVGLYFGANNYASAQSSAQIERLDKNTIDYTQVDNQGQNLVGQNIRGPVLNHRVRGDTIYIGLHDESRPRSAYAIFEFVAKPEEIDFIEQLVDLEIKSEREYDIYFKGMEQWNGRAVKASHLEIGNNPTYIFEAANAKKE